MKFFKCVKYSFCELYLIICMLILFCELQIYCHHLIYIILGIYKGFVITVFLSQILFQIWENSSFSTLCGILQIIPERV